MTITHVSTGWFYDAATTLTLRTSIELDAARAAVGVSAGAAADAAADAAAGAADAILYSGMMHCAIEQVSAARPLARDRV